MLLRGVAVWGLILVLATANGALRDFLLTPRMGDTPARALSSMILSGLVFLVAWLTIRWIAPAGAGEAMVVGTVWVLLTLIFEFGAGHYLFHKPWPVLLEDYNLRRGRIWILVLIVTLIAPVWSYRLRS